MVVAPTIDKMVQPCAATINEEELELVAPFLPINRHQERVAEFEQNREENKRDQERKRGCLVHGKKERPTGKDLSNACMERKLL